MRQPPSTESNSTPDRRPWLWWLLLIGIVLAAMVLIETLITHLPADYPM